MSEYQYYEFLAVDRPLGEADRDLLRELSSRARITSWSFTNFYEWGDFKGDPVALMERRRSGVKTRISPAGSARSANATPERSAS